MAERTSLSQPVQVRAADEVWIATALLHREQPDREDFTVEEILRRAEQEGLAPSLRPGVAVHAYLHCVANRAPNPARYRMLFATGKSTRRLYRPGDPAEIGRTGKIIPQPGQIPERCRELLDWYEQEYCRGSSAAAEPLDPIIEAVGLGADIWRGVDADEYVRSLREGWE